MWCHTVGSRKDWMRSAGKKPDAFTSENDDDEEQDGEDDEEDEEADMVPVYTCEKTELF